jgi:hypothetical protein
VSEAYDEFGTTHAWYSPGRVSYRRLRSNAVRGGVSSGETSVLTLLRFKFQKEGKEQIYQNVKYSPK